MLRHWRVWDDEIVVFHPKSGETHCLNFAAARALRIMAERAVTASELVDLLRTENAAPPSVKEIDSLLQQFDDFGLISRTP